MSKPNSEFVTHPLWAKIDELETVLKNHKAGRGALDLGIKAKTRAAITYMNRFKSDYLLAPVGWHSELLTVSSEVDQILNQFSNWVDGGVSPSVFNTIEACLDRSLRVFVTWPLHSKGSSKSGESEAHLLLEEIAAYRDEQVLAFQKIEQSSLMLQAELEAAKQQWRSESESLATVRGEVKAAAADITIAAKQNLSEDSTEVRKIYASKLDEVLAEAIDLKEEIVDLVEESKNLAALKAGEVISSGYGVYARELHKLRVFWQIAGFVVGALTVATLFTFTLAIGNSDFAVQYTLKASITLTLGALSAYSFREASQAGRAAEVARYRQLDSVALSTYIRGLKSDETVVAIQGELGRRLASGRSQKATTESKETIKVVRDLINAIEKITSNRSR